MLSFLTLALGTLLLACTAPSPPAPDDLTAAQSDRISDEVRARTTEFVRAVETPDRELIEPLLAQTRPVRISIDDQSADGSRYLGAVDRTPTDFSQRIDVLELEVIPLTSSTALAYYTVESRVISPELGPLESWRNEVVWFREPNDWRIVSFSTVSTGTAEAATR